MSNSSPETDADLYVLVRPSEFETDYEWACDLDTRLFEATSDLDEARFALNRVEDTINAWKIYQKDVEEAKNG